MAAVNTISVVPVKLVLGVGAVTTISVVARLGAGLGAGGSSESTLILRGFIGSTTTLTSTGTEF